MGKRVPSHHWIWAAWVSRKTRLAVAEPRVKMVGIWGVQGCHGRGAEGIHTGSERLSQRGSGNPNSRDQADLPPPRAGRCQRQRLRARLAQNMSIHSTILIEDLLHANHCSRHWGYSHDTRQKSLACTELIPVGGGKKQNIA